MLKRFLEILGVSFLLVACGDDDVATNEEKAGDIVATTGQIADAVKVISGEHLAVTTLMGPGVDLHLYKATQVI